MGKGADYYNEKYGHLGANVPRRRKMYGWIIVLAILTFIGSIADIAFYLDGDYLEHWVFFVVMGIYVVLLIWAFIMLFSRAQDFDVVEYDDNDDFEAERSHLRCPTCRHVFAFDMERLGERASGVGFNCPECGTVHSVPPPERDPVEAAVPGGGSYGPSFACDHCGEHWSVGALGHDPKAAVSFTACPHCGVADEIRPILD